LTQVPFRLLIVEDDEEDYLLTRRLLSEKTRAGMKWARSYETALEELRTPYDACLVDYRLGAHTGLALIETAIARGFRGPMILLTGQGDDDVDVEAMRVGAADYLVKGQITQQLLERVIRHSIERKAAESALRRSEEQLRQSQKMEAIGSLAGGVAHDFNNLLSVILGYSQMLAEEFKVGDPIRADLDEINGAGLRAAELTRQLLAFSRQQVLQPTIVDLNEIFTGMEKMLRRLIGEDVELEWLAAPALDKILVDPGQMEQVIMNLTVNARDAMPEGGKLTVQTANVVLTETEVAEHAGVKAGAHVMLAVTDTGHGMDAATQARIFEPFFTTKEVGKGTGLGLSTVFGIVKQSGGAIGAWSEPGKGTIFTTWFPVTRAAATRMSRPDGGSERRPLRGSETVLVVEDEERVRLLVRTILTKYGYRVLEAQSAGDALIVCEQHGATIELLLADVVLPRISGPHLAARLVSTRPEMKVLYMSGYAGASMLQHGVVGSGAPFLQKPFTPEVLARAVRDVLDLTDIVETAEATADRQPGAKDVTAG
jgi:two-component system cell cycle sensor histidine kinase/response regulator CckA